MAGSGVTSPDASVLPLQKGGGPWTEEHTRALMLAYDIFAAAIFHDRVALSRGITEVLLFGADHALAKALIEEVQNSNFTEDWVCPNCAEEVPRTFDLCWNCETLHPELDDFCFATDNELEPAVENVV